MKNCFAYVRVSTQKQSVHGVSLQEQRSAIERYAAKNDIAISRWFEERVTAAKTGRPCFNDMLDRLRRGEAEGVVIHKIDRSARNFRDWAAVGDLVDAGIEFHFAAECLDLASRSGRLAADIQAVVAADYIRNLRQEARKGIIGRLKQGYYPLAAPVGYLDKGGGRSKEIDPINGPLMRRAFELYATGEFSLDDLIRKLGIRHARTGNIVRRSSLSRALHNPFYIGIMQMKRSGAVYKGNHEPLIDRKLFDQVQDVLAGKLRRTDTVHRYRYARLFTCAGCGFALTAERQKGHVYYRCHQRSCSTKTLREELLSASIDDFLRSLSICDQGRRALRRKIDTLVEQVEADEAALDRAIEMRLRQVTEQLNRLTDAFVDGTLEKALFEERRVSLLVRREEIEKEKRAKRHSKENLGDRARRFFELLESASFSHEMATPEEKVSLLKILSSNRRACAKYVDIEPRKPWQYIQKMLHVAQCAPLRTRVRTDIDEAAKEIFDCLIDPDSRESRWP